MKQDQDISKTLAEAVQSAAAARTPLQITGGIEKINQMCAQFKSAELTQFHAVRTAFDPAGLLNPGKAVPTLARCAEFGRMHVHAGQLPFPGLERF